MLLKSDIPMLLALEANPHAELLPINSLIDLIFQLDYATI